MAVLFIDLDHFKTVNDFRWATRGRRPATLCEMARRLQEGVNGNDFIAAPAATSSWCCCRPALPRLGGGRHVRTR